MMRIFKNKPFTRFARKHEISDDDLCQAVRNAKRGLIDADLGGGVIKQRIARKGEGKSGGFRTLILIKFGELAFFVHGFAKNDLANITASELAAFKKLATIMLAFHEDELALAVASGTLIEVQCNGKIKAIS
jgi:hypothetical protein